MTSPSGDPTSLSERRPIATRETRGAKSTAAWLARVGVSPNAISIAGMLAGIAGGVALAATTQAGFTRAG
ncbi:MAG: hypothetical protein ACYTGC_13970, partial [Planctomycetota bacterium]